MTYFFSTEFSLDIVDPTTAKRQTPNCLNNDTLLKITYDDLRASSMNYLVSARGVDESLVVTSLENGCQFKVTVNQQISKTPIILGSILGFVVIVLVVAVLAFYLYRHRPVNLRSLPKSVRFPYEVAQGVFPSPHVTRIFF